MFAERLKKLRKEKKMSQQQMADFLGITRQGYAKYEKSGTEPSFAMLEKMASFFDVTTDYLLGNSGVSTWNNTEVREDKPFYMSKIANEFPDIDLMFRDMESLTAEEMKEVYEYVKFKLSQKKGDK